MKLQPGIFTTCMGSICFSRSCLQAETFRDFSPWNVQVCVVIMKKTPNWLKAKPSGTHHHHYPPSLLFSSVLTLNNEQSILKRQENRRVGVQNTWLSESHLLAVLHISIFPPAALHCFNWKVLHCTNSSGNCCCVSSLCSPHRSLWLSIAFCWQMCHFLWYTLHTV